MSETKEVLVVVLCVNSEGAPEMFAVPVNVTDEEYSNGEHYEIAKEKAVEDGYEKPMIAFDQNDPAGQQIISGSLTHWAAVMLRREPLQDEDDRAGAIAAHLSRRIEDGDLNLEDIPARMARYGMMLPQSFLAEMEERMLNEDELQLDAAGEDDSAGGAAQEGPDNAMEPS